MLKPIIVSLLFFLFIILYLPQTVEASEKAKSVSAEFLTASEDPQPVHIDNRADTLKKFLEKYDSDLADEAPIFIKEADRNNIDWKLLPAISGVESTFGQAVPPHCNNAWGYNIYGDHTRCFATYKDAIQVISYDLRHLYMDQWGAKDVYGIGHLYAASPTWAWRVDMYIHQIDDFNNKITTPTLPISL